MEVTDGKVGAAVKAGAVGSYCTVRHEADVPAWLPSSNKLWFRGDWREGNRTVVGGRVPS